VNDTTPDDLAQTIRRLLADCEDARKSLNRARVRFEAIGDQLAALRAGDPAAYAAAYKEAKK
jgi:hypothetical protein